ncbi:MAG TPA: DUF3857 domain-containing protein, partial [Luteimonas sp.]|nr:DUF3857 domain-containing protein [Luteimonas sp.]
MSRVLSFLAAIALLAASGVGDCAIAVDADVARAPLPGWVVRYALPEARNVRSSSGVRYLLIDDQTNLASTVPVYVRTMGYEVVSERGLTEAGRFTLSYQPLYETVQLHAVDVQRDGAWKDRLAEVDVEVLRRESDLETSILDGRLTLHVTVPDLRVGDRVVYRYSVRGGNPVFGRYHFTRYGGSYGVAVGERRVRYLFPAALPLRWRVIGQPYRQHETRAGDLRTLSMVAGPVPRTLEQPDTPGWYDPTGTIEVTTARDWAEVATWGARLYPAQMDDRGLASELTRNLRLDRRDPAGSLERAVAFVQGDVRYMAVGLGANSHVPYPPSITVRRRFGDCKDKSALLVALLAEAGIESEPVLVNTVARGTVRDWFPSAAVFDHVVVRVHMPDGDTWVDATRDRERGPLTEREPVEFGVGLPLRAGSGLVEIPALVPADPLIDVQQRIRIERAGARWNGFFGVVTTYRQSAAVPIRQQFQEEDESEIGDQYLAYMHGFYDGIRANALPRGAEEGSDG